MAFKHYLIILISLLIFGCAEVGTISGGPKDEIAPKIIKSSIQNGSTNFNSQSIELTFDEFIQLNKPNENIFIVPQHAKLEAQLLKRSLKIKLSNQLQNNTTYTLYLNSAVKDVTEGNDSLIQITFSTGPKLDSLKFSAQTIDAFSNKVKSKITIGLFDSLKSEKPIYFGQSNSSGFLELKALKEGTYFCKAFEDKNKDLQIQKDEAQDWIFDPFLVNGDSLGIINFNLSTPDQTDKIKNARLIPPGLVGMHVPETIEVRNLSLNNSELKKEQYWRPQEDSLHIAIGELIGNEIQLIVNLDTFNLRRLEKNKATKLVPKNVTKDDETTNCSTFEVMDFVQSVDTSKIEVMKYPDSLKINFSIKFEQNRITLNPSDKLVTKYRVTFKDGAIKGICGKENSLTKIEIISKEERDFGSLNVKLNKLMPNGIIQILLKDKQIDEQKINSNSSQKPIIFSRLNPGEYTFRIIEDLNQNGKWDPISPENKTKAERVFLFSTPVKVRANWEVETSLELK